VLLSSPAWAAVTLALLAAPSVALGLAWPARAGAGDTDSFAQCLATQTTALAVALALAAPILAAAPRRGVVRLAPLGSGDPLPVDVGVAWAAKVLAVAGGLALPVAAALPLLAPAALWAGLEPWELAYRAAAALAACPLLAFGSVYGGRTAARGAGGLLGALAGAGLSALGWLAVFGEAALRGRPRQEWLGLLAAGGVLVLLNLRLLTRVRPPPPTLDRVLRARPLRLSNPGVRARTRLARWGLRAGLREVARNPAARRAVLVLVAAGFLVIGLTASPRELTAAAAALAAVAGAAAAAPTVAGERARGTWELLVITPAGPAEHMARASARAVARLLPALVRLGPVYVGARLLQAVVSLSLYRTPRMQRPMIWGSLLEALLEIALVAAAAFAGLAVGVAASVASRTATGAFARALAALSAISLAGPAASLLPGLSRRIAAALADLSPAAALFAPRGGGRVLGLAGSLGLVLLLGVGAQAVAALGLRRAAPGPAPKAPRPGEPPLPHSVALLLTARARASG
ncbi:MAG: hypothetical protein L0216_12805, partial [Planctomycetales bacterium]|nr:hypothetical protein [Planctomycetales bacterium]